MHRAVANRKAWAGTRKLVLALYAALLLSPAVSGAGPQTRTGGGSAGNRVVALENSRKLLILPFVSEGLHADLGYMPAALAKALAASIKSIGQISVQSRRQRFVLEPRSPGSSSGVGLSDPSRQLPTNRSGFPGLVLLNLETEIVEANRSNFKDLHLFSEVETLRRLGGDILISGVLRSPPGQTSGKSDEDGPPAAGADTSEDRFGRAFTLELRLYDSVTGRSARLSVELRERTAFRAMAEPALQIVSQLSIVPPVPVSIESDPPDALVFRAQRYLGRTPVQAHLFPGPNRLEFRADGFAVGMLDVAVRSESDNAASIRLRPVEDTAGLRVLSSPPGATVYLGLTKLGTTPLLRNDLPAGAQRLRIVADKHIDRLLGVDLKRKQTVEVNVALEPGDTKSHFANLNRPLLDWTYYDLHFYSLLSTLGCYGFYAYFEIQEDKIQEAIRAEVPLIMPTVAQLQSISSLASSFTVYEYQKLMRNRRDARIMRQRANLSAGVGVASLLAAVAFLYLDIRATPEVGELQGFLRTPGSPAAMFARSGHRSESSAPGALGSQAEVGVSISF